MRDSADEFARAAPRGPLQNAILIAGATASGKSALALRLALETGGVVVNADSMQVYSVLDRITARPSPADLAAAPHLLYGHVHPAAAYSTGEWLRDVARIADEGRLRGRRAIFVGGTGLYFEALLDGLSRMPEIAPPVRARWRARLAAEGAAALHRLLAESDPAAAERLEPGDGQRVVRALEVLEASGRSILDWQAERESPLVERASASLVALDPDRAWLAERIAARFGEMVRAGAVEEARRLAALGLDPSLPAMKAIGVRELLGAAEGKLTLEDAVASATAATRRYAKRQATWMRNRFGPEWRRLENPGDLSAGDMRTIFRIGDETAGENSRQSSRARR